MYVCIYVYTHICMYVCVCVHIQTHAYICICVRVCESMFVFKNACTTSKEIRVSLTMISSLQLPLSRALFPAQSSLSLCSDSSSPSLFSSSPFLVSFSSNITPLLGQLLLCTLIYILQFRVRGFRMATSL